MTGSRRLTSVAIASFTCFLLLAGCSEGIVLRDEAGAFELRYECSAFRPAARSTSEFMVVRDYAIRAVSFSNQAGDMDAVRPMMTADADGSLGELERLVVEYLCAGGGLAEPIQKKPREGPSIAEIVEEFRSRESPVELHTSAPEFRLPLLTPKYLTGEASLVDLRDLRGDYVLLNFWGTWCSPCLSEHEELIPVWERFRDRGFSAYGIVYHDKPEWALEWIQERSPHGFPSLVDEDGSVAEAYRVRGVPRTYLIGPNGLVVQTWLGSHERAKLTEALENLLPQVGGGTP